jgi:hypothetical protein
MNAHEYRETMTNMFFHGIMPEAKPEGPREKGAKARPPSKSEVDELRAMHEALAARGKRSEVTSTPSE